VGSYTIPSMDYYRLQLIPYLEIQGYMQQKLEIQQLIYWLFVIDIPKFKAAWFMSLIVNQQFSVCPGMGYNVDKIELVLSTRIRIEECYKKLIVDLCNLPAVWTLKEAKYLDECKQSTDVNIDLNRWWWVAAQTDVIHYGTVSPSSVDYCYPLPGIGTKDQTVTVITGSE